MFSCSCFDGRSSKKGGGKEHDPQQLKTTMDGSLAPLPIPNLSKRSVDELRAANSNSSFATTAEGADEKAAKALAREDKAQKKKERHDARMKEIAEQDMMNGPFADQLKAEAKAEKKKNKTPGWDHDGDDLQAIGQQELLDGPETQVGASPTRAKGIESVASLPTDSSAASTGKNKKKKKGKK